MDSSLNYLELLPDEMLLKLLIETDDLKTLSKWCQTSKRVNQICQDKGLWKQKYLKDYGETTLTEGETWQEKYKQKVSSNINSPISVGWDHYGIVDQNRKLYMIGNNDHHQFGIGNTNKYDIPMLVRFPYNSQKVISLSVGARITGAVTMDGRAYIWGGNEENIFNTEDEEEDYEDIKIPREIELPRKAKKIVVDYTGYLILLEDSSVYYDFVRILAFKSSSRIQGDLAWDAIDISISGGNESAVAIIDGDHKLYIWGSLPKFGMTGAYNRNMPSYDTPLPELVTKVVLGYDHIMVLSVTGKVYTWGKNSEGQLGLGNRKAEIKAKLVKLPETIVQIDAGRNVSAALSDTGRLYMWGNNYMGHIATDPRENFLSPVEISLGLYVNYISFGLYITLAVTNDGAVNKFVSKNASE